MQGLANVWGPLDDMVMGGVAESGFSVQQGERENWQPASIFSFTVSSYNNGGFASVSYRSNVAGITLVPQQEDVAIIRKGQARQHIALLAYTWQPSRQPPAVSPQQQTKR